MTKQLTLDDLKIGMTNVRYDSLSNIKNMYIILKDIFRDEEGMPTGTIAFIGSQLNEKSEALRTPGAKICCVYNEWDPELGELDYEE